MTESRKSSRQYWLGLSLVYAVSLSVFTLAPDSWPLVFVMAALLFLIVQAAYYGQIGRKIQGTFATATPGVGLLAMTGGAIAILLRGSQAAYWAGPLLSVAGFVAMFFFLNRFGRFYSGSRDDQGSASPSS
ncbi:hypothetical protein [Sinomonas albida]|uniref:hypothetical protein n=1 Tax=Sinomonas albida TaxID=369942 RepID=UPI0010A858C7|nr:hypothetical protein [Sinomonas albida]